MKLAFVKELQWNEYSIDLLIKPQDAWDTVYASRGIEAGYDKCAPIVIDTDYVRLM